MFKNFIAIVAVLFLTTCFINPVYADKVRWKDVKSPSYCAGYAKVKDEQHNKQYYKDMFSFYNSMISETDLMAKRVDREDFLQGYDMNDDEKTLECVEVFNYIRGFDE
ncbi:hypothetical protein A4_171 [Escherichia phage A4]|nr:hypothetical protein A4_171 [Escherichia phage A4]